MTNQAPEALLELINNDGCPTVTRAAYLALWDHMDEEGIDSDDYRVDVMAYNEYAIWLA
jgi:hypothetical protein